MAEINKLSVRQALDKLRRPDVQSKQTRLHEKMDALDEDMQRMRATRRRLERDQRAGSPGCDATDFRHLKSNIQVSVVGYGGGQKKDQALFWLPPYGYGCALMSPHPKFPPAPVVFYIGSITRSSAASGLAVGLLLSVLSASDVDD